MMILDSKLNLHSQKKKSHTINPFILDGNLLD